MDSTLVRSFGILALCGLGLVAHASCATSDDSVIPPADGGASDAINFDSSGCGEQGQPCCTTGEPCESTAFCNAGTCRVANPADIGKPCTNNSDCMSGYCGYLQGIDGGTTFGGDGGAMMPASPTVCTEPCSSNAQCLGGWTCTAIIMGQGVCTCAPVPEQCDGKDDNCDGKVDEEPGADLACSQENGVAEKCVGGQCTCVSECSGQCVDLTTDPNNCGVCGTVCTPSVQTCSNSKCTCSATLCPAADGGVGADGGTEVCVDTTSDPNNCGGCGTHCDYACTNAQCGPLQLASVGIDGAQGIAADGTNVYWLTTTFGGVIEECAVTGCNGAGTLLASNVNGNNFGAGVLSLGGTSVFWPDELAIMEAPIAAGTPTSFAVSSSPYAIASDGTNIYWTDTTLGILKCAIGATCPTPTTVLSLAALGASGAPELLAVDSTYLYWSDENEAIYSYPLAGGSKVTLSPSTADVFPTMLLASGGRLYWTDFTGQVTTVLATSTTSAPYYAAADAYGLATDGTNLYWTDQALGTVSKCALGATCTTPTTVASGTSTPTFLAVDAAHVYWVAGSNTIGIYEFSK